MPKRQSASFRLGGPTRADLWREARGSGHSVRSEMNSDAVAIVWPRPAAMDGTIIVREVYQAVTRSPAPI